MQTHHWSYAAPACCLGTPYQEAAFPVILGPPYLAFEQLLLHSHESCLQRYFSGLMCKHIPGLLPCQRLAMVRE